VNMFGFVFDFCGFPTSCNACNTGLMSETLSAMLERANYDFTLSYMLTSMDKSSKDKKIQKAKPDIFTETPFISFIFYFFPFYFF